MGNAFLGPAPLRLGSKDAPATGAHVAELQAELQRMQVLQPGELVTVGVFDDNTEAAVRRLQWFAGQVPAALAATGNSVPRPLSKLAVNGVVGPRLKAMIQTFKANAWAATGLLVQLDFDTLSHTHPNAGFAALLNGNARIAVCERVFAQALDAMNTAAQQFGVFIFVNQLFRAEGSTVSGAVVPPASFSAHKLGRAVDLQLGTHAELVAGSNPQASISIQGAQAGTPFARFRQHAKTVLKCRYGGDFDPVDPPHFDLQILPGGSQTWKMHYFFNQLQYRQALSNPGAIPDAALP